MISVILLICISFFIINVILINIIRAWFDDVPDVKLLDWCEEYKVFYYLSVLGTLLLVGCLILAGIDYTLKFLAKRLAISKFFARINIRLSKDSK